MNIQVDRRSDLDLDSRGSTMASMFTKPGNRRYWIAGGVIALLIVLGVGFSWGGSKPTMASHNIPNEILVRIATLRLNSGYDMPVLGWGSYMLTGEKCTEATQSAVQAGYRHIDTAAVYGNEGEVGAGLKAHLESGGVKREDLFVTTKLWSDKHARDDVVPALRESLSKLGLDYVDLFLIHWPITNEHGPTLQPPMQDTWDGMQEAVDKGLTRSIGVSNFSPEKIDDWFSDARIYPAVNQIEIHPHWRNDRVVQFCKDKGIVVTAYAPLSSPGNMGQFPNDLQNPNVLDVVNSTGKSPAQVVLRWGIQRGYIVIPKSTSPAHQQENLGAVGWDLSQDDVEKISNISTQIRYFEGGGFAYNEEGPWHSYEELWNEDRPSDQP